MRHKYLSRRIKTLKKGLATTLLGSFLIGIGTPGFAETDYDAKIEALESDLEALRREVAESASSSPEQEELAGAPSEDAAALPPTGVEGSPNPLQRNGPYLTGKDLLDASFPGSIPIPGSDWRFRVGGYVKLDFIQDLDYVGDRFEFELATIPVEGTPEYALDGLTTLHAKESRINFDFRTKARNESRGWEFPLQAYLEIDFFDDRESFSLQPRLRLAYGVIGRLTAGRSWAVTTDLEALTGTIDFSGGDSLYGGRVAQIRWDDRIGKSTRWAIGVENPTPSIGNPLGLGGDDRSSLPSFAGILRRNIGNGSHIQLGGDVFRLEWQGGDGGPSDTEVGFGASLSGRLLLSKSRKDALTGAFTVGRGSAHRVISLSYDGGNDAVITPDGLDTMSHWQAYVGYSHYWTKSLNSAITVAWAELDNSDFQPGNAIHKAGSLHVNLIWFPYKLVSTGIEYMYGVRENKDGADGNASRLQYMVKFIFN